MQADTGKEVSQAETEKFDDNRPASPDRDLHTSPSYCLLGRALQPHGLLRKKKASYPT